MPKQSQHYTCSPKANRITTSRKMIQDKHLIRHQRSTSPIYKEERHLKALSEVPYEASNNTPTDFERAFPQKALATQKINELLLHAIGQTAIPTFVSNSLEIFAQDTYTIDDGGAIRAKTFAYSRNRRLRVRHHVSSHKSPFGCVWIRTTNICLPDEASDTREISQCITSFVFYPSIWVQKVGFRRGVEAVIASVARGWVFNCKLTVTRAVPEDSLIFELCRSGQTRAVEILFRKGLASIGDTSPKGWKPLHVRSIASRIGFS
jgi:hypothetical protein